MRKRSRLLSEISESDRWWDCRMELIVEWTFEGSLKSQESMACREPDPLPTGVYVSTCKRTVELLKLSGTARMIYRLNPKWDWGFFYSFAIKKALDMHTAVYKEDVASDHRRRKNVPRHILFKFILRIVYRTSINGLLSD